MPGLEGRAGNRIGGPSLIRVPDWIPNPLGRYYLYFAHHTGRYIRLAYANSLQGPWSMYQPGTLHLNQTVCKNHIASPDVLVDRKNHEIRMYFHGIEPQYGRSQVTCVARSQDGLNFIASSEVLGPFYFRVFEYNGWYYAIAKNKNIGGIFLRSLDGLTPFETGATCLSKMRHAAILSEENTLFIFYSRIGDAPESILMSYVDLKTNWPSWTPSPPRRILKPEKSYEGVNLFARFFPVKPSKPGSAKKRVRQLRDPAIYREDSQYYLLYSIAGESGIAMAELKWNG